MQLLFGAAEQPAQLPPGKATGRQVTPTAARPDTATPAHAGRTAPAAARSSGRAGWRQRARPAVTAFQTCLANSAASSPALPPGELIARAVDGACRADFDRLAGVIVARLGERGFAAASRELIATVFVPTARKALAAAGP